MTDLIISNDEDKPKRQSINKTNRVPFSVNACEVIIRYNGRITRFSITPTSVLYELGNNRDHYPMYSLGSREPIPLEGLRNEPRNISLRIEGFLDESTHEDSEEHQ